MVVSTGVHSATRPTEALWRAHRHESQPPLTKPVAPDGPWLRMPAGGAGTAAALSSSVHAMHAATDELSTGRRRSSTLMVRIGEADGSGRLHRDDPRDASCAGPGRGRADRSAQPVR